jgi:hypothetical protein
MFSYANGEVGSDTSTGDRDTITGDDVTSTGDNDTFTVKM